MNFTAGSFADNQGNGDVAATKNFTVHAPPTAALSNPADGATAAVTQLNNRGYIDVAFSALGAAGLNANSITDADPEFTLTGAAAADVVVSSAPTLVSGGVYRYSFTGSFSTGTVGISFIDGSWADSAGMTNVGVPNESFDVEVGGRTVTFDSLHKAVYTDASGDVVTVSLTGAGSGELWFSSDDSSVHQDATWMALTGVTTTSALAMSISGDLKRTTLTSITADGCLRQITAPGLTVNGPLTVGGTLGGLTVDGLSGSTIDIRGDGSVTPDAKAQLALTANDVVDTGLDTHGEPIKSITAWEWAASAGHANGSIVSSWIGNLTIKGRKELTGGLDGNFQANLDLALSRDDLSVNRPALALGNAKINGTLRPTSWEIGGGIGNLQIAAVTAGSIEADSIKNFKVTGLKSAINGSSIVGDCDASVILDGAATGATLGTAMIAGTLTPTDWEIDGDVTTIQAAAVDSGTIDAASINNLKTTGIKGSLAGNFQADVNLSGAATGYTLGTAAIAGTLTPGAWQITGAANKISAAAVASGSIAANSINNLKTTGIKGLLAGNFQADVNLSGAATGYTLGMASIAGTLTPGDWEIAGAANTIGAAAVGTGSIAANSINSLKTTGIKGVLAGDFQADVHLTGAATGFALGKAAIAGDLLSDTWSISGDMGNLQVTGTASGTVIATGSMGALSLAR